jgi:hypothetical protein
MSRARGFLAELRRRRGVRAAIVYVAGAFPAADVAPVLGRLGCYASWRDDPRYRAVMERPRTWPEGGR